MSFTQTQLDKIETAILDLVTGQQVARVTLRGRTVEYVQADLPQLRALRDEVRNEINRGKKKSTYILGVSRKGL